MTAQTTKTTIKLTAKAAEAFNKIRSAGEAGMPLDILDGRTMRQLTRYKLVAKIGTSKVRLSKTGQTYAGSSTESAPAVNAAI